MKVGMPYHLSSITYHFRRRRSGFTLIEIIVVVGILGIVTVMGTNLFFSILRGSTKTKILQLVKQNGDYAISVMGRMIRNARSVNGGGSSITIVNPDGMPTTFSCGDIDIPLDGKSEIASNGARLISNEVKVENCSGIFSVTPGEVGVSPAAVTINFTLSQAGVTTRLEERASVSFQTTISLRNY